MADSAAFQGNIPELYDRHLGPVLFEAYAQDLAARLSVSPHANVLELACGTGIVTRQLVGALPPGARLLATDLNPDMLSCAASRVAADPRLAWRQADAMKLPFKRAVVDCVVCQFGVMFFPDKRAAAAEARRVLRLGGTYMFNVWGSLDENPFARIAHETIARFFPKDPPQFYMTPFGYCDEATIRADLAAGGFSSVMIETVDKPAHSVSAADFAIGLVRGIPVVADIRARGTADVAAVEAAITAALSESGGASPYESSLRALVVTAVA